MRASYDRYGDLRGWSSRWSARKGTDRGDRAQRDRQIREAVGEWLENDGRRRHQCTVTRAGGYVGVYVDAYKVQEERRVTGPYGERGGLWFRGSGDGGRGTGDRGRGVLERLLSRQVERGKPVWVQRSLLNEYTATVPASHWERRSDGVRGGRRARYRWDRRQVCTLLGRLPVARLWATRRARRRTGGEPQGLVRRRGNDLRRAVSRSPRGLWRPAGDADAAAVARRSRGGGRWQAGRARAERSRAPGWAVTGDRTGARTGEGTDGSWWTERGTGRGRRRQDGEASRDGPRGTRPGAAPRVRPAEARAGEADTLLGFRGYRWSVKGRVRGRERKGVKEWRQGRLPRHQRTAGRDYGERRVDTFQGSRRVRRRVYYG